MIYGRSVERTFINNPENQDRLLPPSMVQLQKTGPYEHKGDTIMSEPVRPADIERAISVV
jgi:hypothetical protein